MNMTQIQVCTYGEKFYSITNLVEAGLKQLLKAQEGTDKKNGVLFLFLMHTSCGLVVNENYDPSAQKDMEKFLHYLAPRSLPFITHTLEGPDDSPSHMKSLLLHQHLAFIVEKGNLVLGQWQGIFLAEFRDDPKERTITLKFILG